MIFRSWNMKVVARLVLFLIVAIAFGVSAATKTLPAVILCSILLGILLYEFIHYFNGFSRKISYFFDAVRNEDSTLHFSEKIRDTSLRQLHIHLNQLNEIISEIKIRNEYNERFFRELLRYSATGIIAADEKGYIELINEAALKLLGLKTLAHLSLLEQKRKDVYNELMQLNPGQTRTLKLLKEQEIQQLSVKVSHLTFGKQSFRVFSIYDIKAEMEENEVESWQKIFRVLTHEIMNSVAPITSLSKTLQRFLVSDENDSLMDEPEARIGKAREGLGVIEETGKGLMHFIDNYRKLTKIPKPVFNTIDIEAWLNRTCILYAEKFKEESIEFEQSVNTRQTEFLADEKLLSQVLMNIFNNAIDALKGRKNKKILLRADNEPNGRFRIAISDTGKGIAAEELDKIFIPFYTTKEHGSGIGLSISRQIMRLHRGNISVMSTVGKPTTVTLMF